MKNDRLGMFTSSKISDLTTDGSRPMTKVEKLEFVAKGGDKRTKNTWDFGKPFYTLCEEKAMEVILKRGLENDMRAGATDWGNLCESFAFQLLPLDYAFNVKRYTHINLPWSGIPDSMSANHVGDIKCPFTLKSAFGMAMLRTGEEVKEHAPWYYWQLVSNAILCNRSNAELDIFVPKITRAKEIMAKAVETESLIRFKTLPELPFLPVDSDFPELTRISFEIPESDMLFLEGRIIAASEERDAKIDEYRKLFGI